MLAGKVPGNLYAGALAYRPGFQRSHQALAIFSAASAASWMPPTYMKALSGR